MLIWKSLLLRRSKTPSWKSIEHWTRQTRRYIACWKKIHLSLSTKVAELNSIRDKRVYTDVCEADAKIISGNWVLKPHKVRYVLRGFEEDVKDEDVFASTSVTSSVRMLLSQATDFRNEGYTVFTADVKTAFLDAELHSISHSITRTRVAQY